MTPKIGIYSRYITGLKNSIRSLNPIASISAIGKNAKEICNRKTASAYGIDSPFDVLTKLNAKNSDSFVLFVSSIISIPQLKKFVFSLIIS